MLSSLTKASELAPLCTRLRELLQNPPALSSTTQVRDIDKMLKLCKLYACPNGTLGLHLSRAPWDPYPWVSGIQNDSSAQRAGVRNGDTVLEMNGRDVLGQKISQIAEHIGEHWKSGATYITIVIWRNQNENNIGDDEGDSDVVQSENNQHQQQQHQGINQQSLQKFATCLQHIAQLLECPVCLEVIRPPGWQCCNGHVLCNNCRSRSVKCPVCRVPLGPRGRCLMSDKLFTLLAESFPCDGVRKDNGEAYNNPTTETNKCTPDFHNRPKMATMQPTNPKETTIKVKKTKPVQRQIKRVADEVADDGIATDGNGIKDDGSECSTDVVKQQLNTVPGEVEVKADGSTATTKTTMTIKSSGNIARVCLRRTTSQEETGKVHHQLNELKSQKEKFFDGTVTMTTNPPATTSSNRRLNEGEESFARHVEKVKNKAPGNGYADNNGTATVQQQRWASKLLVNKENNNSNIKEDVKLKLKSNEKSTDCLMDNCGGNNFKFIAVNNDNRDHKCTVIRINAKC